MFFRRVMIAAAASAPLMACMVGVAQARTPSAAAARAFISDNGDRLVAIINSNDSNAQKTTALRQLVNQIVDVDQVSTYVLGRYNEVATPAQKQRFQELFRELLSYNITYQIRAYKGVQFTVDGTTPMANDIVVNTTIAAPEKAPAAVGWVVEETPQDQLKIVDVIAAGTSLRITTRNDYAGVIADNGGQVSALLNAMQRQINKITAAN